MRSMYGNSSKHHFKPWPILMMFLGMVYAVQTRETHTHIILDPEMDESLSLKERHKCQKVKKIIAKLATIMPHAAEAVDSPIFKVRCINRKSQNVNPYIKKKLYQHFNITSGKITFFVDNPNLTTVDVSHELVHARAFYSNKQCNIENGKAVYPVYPITIREFHRLNKAFDQGDARVNQFLKLLDKQSKNRLTKNEINQLKKYKSACKGIFIKKMTISFNIPKEQYQVINKALKSRKFVSVDSAKFEGQINIYKIENQNINGKYLASATLTNRIDVLLLIPKIVKQILKEEYKHSPFELRVAEREAHTFERLPKKAQKTFYKEAYKLRQIHVSQCNERSSLNYQKMGL